MGPILAVDAATYRGTVAVFDGPVILATIETPMRVAGTETLMPAVATALAEGGVAPAALAGVVCGEGPGSFTSLRIAAAIAKGICAACKIPLFAVSSLALIVAGGERPPEPGRYLAALDAMRGEVFAALFEVTAAGVVVPLEPAALALSDALSAMATAARARLVGPGEGAAPHARGVARLGGGLEPRRPVDLDSWEPRYGRLAAAQVVWERAHGHPLTPA